MLVLTIKKDEPIWIGDDVAVFLCDVLDKRKIRIGIAAPKSVTILRDDVKKRMQQDGSDRDAE